jgi:hypothetical protein
MTGLQVNPYRMVGEKVRYRTETDALDASARMGFTGHNAYRCRECNRWHVGRLSVTEKEVTL